MARTTAKPWHEALRLRDDLKSEELSLKAFAADLHDVMLGRNPGAYHDPAAFFSLTYPTLRLRALARDVTRRLAGRSDKAVRHLHTTFGGGKTHSLIALVHLAQEPEALPDIPAVREFRAHCGIESGFPRARVAAVVFDRLDAEQGMAAKAPDGALRTLRMPWSALAWQLAGEAGLRLLKSDGTERPTPPATNVVEQLLDHARQEAPAVLILFDEVLWFVRTMADQDSAWVGRMADFLHSLTQAVAKAPRCCLVASLLASDTRKMDEIGRRISKDLHDEFRRVADEGVEPVESRDVPEILRRRLFALDSYADQGQWPQQVMATLNGVEAVDAYTRRHRAAEERRYLGAYPFHPDLVELFYAKWTQLEGFQQTRGILRTLATALRDAERWDRSPIVGAQAFLAAPDEQGLCSATRELAGTAQVEQYEGRSQNWPAILEAELAHAKRARDGLAGLAGREIEQAAVATFLHSQPINQRAATRELKLLVAGEAPDGIELDKGLARWADGSWYLDDTFIDDREDGLPRQWRLGSKPNLKQMHHDARSQISRAALADALEREIRGAKKLVEGARGAGVKAHLLPAHPADIEDDGEFHYAVLGPDAASEGGRPSAHAKRFLDETTGPDRPRARNRNALVLAVPSREGLEIAKEKVRDCLGWEKVRAMLKERDDVDAVAAARLATNLRAASGEALAQIEMAYSVAITVNADNKVAAYRVAVDGAPLFARIVADRRLRIESAAVNAAALLPGGPYDLWAEDEQARLAKDLVGAFAATARLPKMLNRAAILETLVQGCAAGDFVLRATRADRSTRTFWMRRPDATVLDDPSLEVILSEAAELTEVDDALLAPGKLPELWDGGSVALADLAAYFSGARLVTVDKGGYAENMTVPAATEGAIKAAVGQAAQSGLVWLVNGSLGFLEEDVPDGFLNAHAALHPPPAPIRAVDLLPEVLDDGGAATAQQLHAALSARVGKPLPWTIVRQALDDGFRLGLVERTPDSGPWPCDFGGAGAVKLRRVSKVMESPGDSFGTLAAAAALAVHEVQELAEQIGEIRAVTAGHDLRITVKVELGESGKAEQEVVDRLNGILDEIKPGWAAS